MTDAERKALVEQVERACAAIHGDGVAVSFDAGWLVVRLPDGTVGVYRGEDADTTAARLVELAALRAGRRRRRKATSVK